MAPPPHASLGPVLEQSLRAAATDPAFREVFGKDPLAAVRSLGHALTPAEEALLSALPPAQVGPLLEALARSAAQGAMQTQAPPETTGAEAASFGIRPGQIACQGIRPDLPTPVRGITSDLPPMIKGIRPGRVVVAAAATATMIGGGALYLHACSRSHLVAEAAAVDAGAKAGKEASAGGGAPGFPELPPTDGPGNLRNRSRP